MSAFAVAPAGDASAATVTVAKDRDGYNAVYYVAAPGEVNDVVVAAFRESRVRIFDAGATISVEGRCRSIDPHRAVCPSFAQIAHVAVGDLNDRVRALARGPQFAEPESIFNGGPGDDELLAAGEFDRLFGGAGNDQLHGRDGGDKLDGGEGADRLYGGGNRDRLNGGGGHDELFGGGGSAAGIRIGLTTRPSAEAGSCTTSTTPSAA